jgi:glycosyltransferase involved in cell wall biosynthesis
VDNIRPKEQIMKVRKVLYIARTARGGSAFSLYHLVRGLDCRQYEPVVLFCTQEHNFIGDKLAASGINVITLEKQPQRAPSLSAEPIRRRDIGGALEARLGKWAGQVYVFLKACYEFMRWEAPAIWPIVRVIRENKIDLVHLNSGLYHRSGIMAAWLTKTPCVCHVRGLDQPNHFDKLFVRFVDAFIYISRAVADSYVSQRIPVGKGTVIHNAVDLSEFSRTDDSASVRSEFGWTCHESLVGVVGRLDWWKGHEYFLEAVAQVARQVPNLRGLIIGEPENTPKNREYYQKLQSLTKSLGLEDRVIFTGFRSDVPRLMSALDVVVLSSSVPEPFGRVIIEGMAAGKPVVATAAGGVLDIIEDGVNGLLVPPGNPAAMAAAILSLLGDSKRARRLAEAGQRRVHEQFTVQRHVAAVQNIYDSILRSRK